MSCSKKNTENSVDNTCPICLGEKEDEAVNNICKHSFCFVCIRNWALIKNTCPLCRQDIKTISQHSTGKITRIEDLRRQNTRENYPNEAVEDISEDFEYLVDQDTADFVVSLFDH